jgi:hypothetical protein
MAATQTQLAGSIVLAGTSVTWSSGEMALTTASMLMAEVDITAAAATITDFDLWLEGSVDNGLTWFRLIADFIDANGTDVTTPRSNIVNNYTTAAAARFAALYRHVPCMKVRAKASLTGTGSPSVTFTVNVGAK